MPIGIATVRDNQSAEYVKSIAFAEDDKQRALELWVSARGLDPECPILLSHHVLALFDLDMHQQVVELAVKVFGTHARLAHLSNVFAASLCQLGYYREGLSVLEHIKRLDPDYPKVASSIMNIRSHARQAKAAPPHVRKAVQAGLDFARTTPRPSLAVCMIVKDEEEFIVGALESVRGVADQLIVVDTGSKDSTVELAQKAGAEIGHFPWIGDFSAARNASLDMANTDWILVLDADERLEQGSKTALRAVLEECHAIDDLRVVCVRILNFTRSGQFMSDGFSGRLFRRRPEMRFEGKVHEEVAKGRANVSTDYRLDLKFEHYGADPDVMQEKSKDDRNIALLQSRLRERPDDLLTWFYLASQHWVARRRDDAMLGFRRVVELYERNPSEYGVGVRNVPVPYSYVGLVRGLLDSGRASEALGIARRGLARFHDNPDLVFQAALGYLEAGEVEAARDTFKRAASIKISGYGLIGMHDRSIGEWRALKMAVDIDFGLENLSEAYDGYQELIPKLPEDFDEWHIVYARLVELASQLDDNDRLAEYTVRYLHFRPSQLAVALQVAHRLATQKRAEEAWELLGMVYEEVEGARLDKDFLAGAGQIAEQMGQDQRALNWYERVVELGNQDPRFWLALAQLFSRNGATQEAQEAFGVAQAYLRELQSG